MEILGDLKKYSDIADWQKEARIIAKKLLPACSTVHPNFRTLIRGELSGYPLAMDGRPNLMGGKQIISKGGKRGVVFEESEESKALFRWQEGNFTEAEELLSEHWRLATQSINSEAMRQKLRGEYSSRLNLKSIDDTAAFVDDLMAGAPPNMLLTWFLADAGVTPPKQIKGCEVPFFRKFPYTAHCVRVSLIFHFALAFGLVSTRPTNRVDLEYFYYVPFCQAFSSGDAFHKDVAPVVLRNVPFIVRDDLKADLKKLSQAHTTDNESRWPPEDPRSVTYQLWKSLMVLPPGVPSQTLKLSPETSAKLFKEFQSTLKNGTPAIEPFKGSQDDIKFMALRHKVRLDGPCICGSEKKFLDCCGKSLAKSKLESG